MELSKKLDIPLSFSVLTADYKNPDFKDFLLDENDYEQMNNIGLPKDNRDSHKPQEDNDIGIQCRDCCPVGHRSISIGADGSIYPCHMLHVKDLVMGNILTDDMYKILDNKTNMFASLSVDNMEKCNICEYKYICGGGCRATSYYKYGNFFSPDADCENFHSVFSKKIKDIKNKCNIE
jgi:radical SAM protein with 4Fe4S-binding SPASM domain